MSVNSPALAALVQEQENLKAKSRTVGRQIRLERMKDKRRKPSLTAEEQLNLDNQIASDNFWNEVDTYDGPGMVAEQNISSAPIPKSALTEVPPQVDTRTDREREIDRLLDEVLNGPDPLPGQFDYHEK